MRFSVPGMILTVFLIAGGLASITMIESGIRQVMQAVLALIEIFFG